MFYPIHIYRQRLIRAFKYTFVLLGELLVFLFGSPDKKHSVFLLILQYERDYEDTCSSIVTLVCDDDIQNQGHKLMEKHIKLN